MTEKLGFDCVLESEMDALLAVKWSVTNRHGLPFNDFGIVSSPSAETVFISGRNMADYVHFFTIQFALV